MQLLHPTGDYHTHSLEFSDGKTSLYNIINEARRLKLTDIAITDHSDRLINHYHKYPEFQGTINDKDYFLKNWKNKYDDINVTFGVEADICDKDGDICDTNKGMQGDFVILSAHIGVYKGLPETITEAYCRAIQRHHKTIDVMGHLDHRQFSMYIDIQKVVRAANDYGVAIELNTAYFGRNGTTQHTIPLLNLADRVMVNSDAHKTTDMSKRAKGIQFLQEQGYIHKENL